jgi:hypothetical protein
MNRFRRAIHWQRIGIIAGVDESGFSRSFPLGIAQASWLGKRPLPGPENLREMAQPATLGASFSRDH